MRYSPTLVDHFLNPRNAGLMRDADGCGSDEYEGCGDLARFYLRAREGRLAEARFQAYGCGPTIAAASVATELAAGRALEDLTLLKAQDIEDALDGLPEDRKHAAEVAAGAMRAAALDALRRGNVAVRVAGRRGAVVRAAAAGEASLRESPPSETSL